MRGYSTSGHGGPDHGWWVELLKDGARRHISLDEWSSRQTRR
jgi:hypothetical protein